MSGSSAAVRAAVCKAESEEWSRGESNVAELRIKSWVTLTAGLAPCQLGEKKGSGLCKVAQVARQCVE